MTSTIIWQLNETQYQQRQQQQPQSQQRDFEENTLLITATSNGNVDNIKALLSDSAIVGSINSQNIYGFTALLTALAHGYKQIAFELIGAGANVHISSLEGLTPLHMAAIHWAIRGGKRDVLTYLLNKPLFVDTKNEDGETPLHLAPALGDEAVVEMLIKAGANSSVKDNEGKTPFDQAKDNNHFKVALLLAKGSGKRNHPYRRSCGDSHSDYERKLMSSQQHLSSLKLSPPHFC